MLACLDAAYTNDAAFAACVLFADWSSSAASAIVTARTDEPAPYKSGAFYARELPVLRAALQKLDHTPDAILIDGYVFLDRRGMPGLGAHLYQTLRAQTPVIGVAKTALRNDDWSSAILRGASQTPLRVTAIGMDQTEAASRVRSMAGAHRIPHMLKLADQSARAATA